MSVAACVLGGTVIVMTAVCWIVSVEQSDASSLTMHLSGRCFSLAVALAGTFDSVHYTHLKLAASFLV